MFSLENSYLHNEIGLLDITEWNNFQRFYEMDIDLDEYFRSDKNLTTRNNQLQEFQL
ncbi:hypothetical protein A3Q56_06355 [Intoshia linei]|uniref:Uncharacterized protein n=1 Tax=Intoshia linei TaxID=1819745 RepID=A0A177AUX3_9BILA|nr:hypothetical protein A3Q56_06355 [Intoshia linei]